jgi:hypothetical protein
MAWLGEFMLKLFNYFLIGGLCLLVAIVLGKIMGGPLVFAGTSLLMACAIFAFARTHHDI